MMNYRFIIYLLLLVLCAGNTFAQDLFNYSNDYKIMFYNVENLFDTENDSLTNDEEFLPDGERFWNKHKYYTKLNHIYKVIIALGKWEPPAIIGICEIENRKVLSDLVNNTPLVKYEYKILHRDSPDRRGIDVAMLYREDYFEPLHTEFITIHMPEDPEFKTRDILYTKGIAKGADTLHVFINHWPSRWGGQLESEDKRIFVAQKLRLKVDSLLALNPNSNIILTGDFNDYPANKSISVVLGAISNLDSIENTNLYNLSSVFGQFENVGSHKYQGEWGVLDQVIVSGALLNQSNRIYTSTNDIFIFNENFLLEPDDAYTGMRPKRNFTGFKYNEGFSDHLPTYIQLYFTE